MIYRIKTIRDFQGLSNKAIATGGMILKTGPILGINVKIPANIVCAKV